MRRRSGALHCETEQQLLELASNHEIGLFYNEGPLFRELRIQNEWSMREAENYVNQSYHSFSYNEDEAEQKDWEKEINRGVRYLENCVVDREAIECSFQICLIVQKMDELLTKMVSRESLLDLFIHTRETTQNCLYKHSTIQSFTNSNVFSLETTNVECTKHLKSDGENQKDLNYFQPQSPNKIANKENHKMTPKNWLKNGKNQKMMELLIVKKHISISQNTEIGARTITLIHRIFIVNEKYLDNPLIKIYLQKSHFLIDMRGETFKPQLGTENKGKNDQGGSIIQNRPRKTSLYNKIFHHKSLFERDCNIFNRGEFLSSQTIPGETTQFKYAFHKVEERIAKNYMRKLNEILIEEKRRTLTSPTMQQK